MVSITWCSKQNKGIKIIEPNDNLCQEYLATAQETLATVRNIDNESNMWLAAKKYYCGYFTVYALLMKIGIKCEIHECTIALCNLIEGKGILPKGTTKMLEEDKQLRIDNQYYLKNREVEFSYDKQLNFILDMKERCTRLTTDNINEIRKWLKEILVKN